MIRGALRAVERFLLPNACVVCGRLVDGTAPDSLVCGPCRSRLRTVPPGCGRCSQPLPPVGPCRFCADWPDGLRNATSAVWLGDEAREIVHHFKYEGFTLLAEMIAATIVRNCPAPPPSASLVPIPLGVRRRLERGYNQATEIANVLGRLWSVPIEETVIRRRRETGSQTTLSPQERVKNMSGVFVAVLPHPAVRAVATQPNIAILVDDVFTTGATLAAAATALLGAGWKEVKAVTFARALPFAVRVETQR